MNVTAKNRRFSVTVRSSYTLAAWVTYPMRESSARAPAGSPSTVSVPETPACTPTIARISVVFPPPDGPRSPVTDPRMTSNSRPFRTCFLPRRTDKPAADSDTFRVVSMRPASSRDG